MHRVRTFSMFLAACAALVDWSAAATAAERPVWELRPYRVRVLVGRRRAAGVGGPSCRPLWPAAWPSGFPRFKAGRGT